MAAKWWGALRRRRGQFTICYCLGFLNMPLEVGFVDALYRLPTVRLFLDTPRSSSSTKELDF